MNRLCDYAYYATERISLNGINETNYVTTDNMVANKKGITNSNYVPSSGTVTEFRVGDVLLSNIRPYFKKVWLADRNGACCSDVLVVRTINDKLTPEFLYAILSQDHFFEYNMAGAKGSKMPRGDKKHIMQYPITIPANNESIGLLLNKIEKKLELNTKICEELESLAKTI